MCFRCSGFILKLNTIDCGLLSSLELKIQHIVLYLSSIAFSGVLVFW